MSIVHVKTQTGEQGNVYYTTFADLQQEHVKVHLTDEHLMETGQTITCQSNTLQPI